MLSLCDFTGNMVRPWANAGHQCTIVDIQHPTGVTVDDRGITRLGMHVEKLVDSVHEEEWDIVFAFPPCTHLANSGARWFAKKGLSKLIESLEIVEACRRICVESGAPFMIENPVGQLSTYMGKPTHRFDPCDYGGYPGGRDDGYTKRTCLWTGGGFVMPEPKPIEAVDGSRMHFIPPGPDRANLRSATPMGFARAVFRANCHTPVR